MEEKGNKTLNSREYAILNLMKKYSVSESVANKIYNDVCFSLDAYEILLDSAINYGYRSDSDYEEAVENRNKLINEINHILSDYMLDGVYRINEKGEIIFNPDYFMDGNNAERWFQNDRGMYYDVYAGIEMDLSYDRCYQPICDITRDEYEYLQSIDFNKDIYNDLIKKKMINKINEISPNKIDNFSLNDNMPIEYRMRFTVGSNEYDAKEDVIDRLELDVIFCVQELSEKYGLAGYISYVIEFIKKTKSEINFPLLPLNKMVSLAKEYLEEEKINDRCTYGEYLDDSIQTDRNESRLFVEKTLKNKFDKEYLQQMKNELEQSKLNEEHINKTIK